MRPKINTAAIYAARRAHQMILPAARSRELVWRELLRGARRRRLHV